MASVRMLNHIIQRRHLIMPSTLYYVNIVPKIKHNTWYSTKKSVTKIESSETDKNKVQVGFAEVVKEKTKSAGYITIIVATVGFGALIIYTLFKELLFSKSPNVVYSKALARCNEEPKVVDLLGAPIKGYGEGRRRRNHVSHMYYIKDDVKHMRVRFYIQGTRRRATVDVDVKENASGDYEYWYLYVTVDHIGTVVLEDNRNGTKMQRESTLIFE